MKILLKANSLDERLTPTVAIEEADRYPIAEIVEITVHQWDNILNGSLENALDTTLEIALSHVQDSIAGILPEVIDYDPVKHVDFDALDKNETIG